MRRAVMTASRLSLLTIPTPTTTTSTGPIATTCEYYCDRVSDSDAFTITVSEMTNLLYKDNAIPLKYFGGPLCLTPID